LSLFVVVSVVTITIKIFVIISDKNMSDETDKAQSAKPTEDTIFGKIARKEIKVDLLHDDDQVFEIIKQKKFL
jgi:hypothetical protein